MTTSTIDPALNTIPARCDDGFSLRRVAAVMAYHNPRIKRQLLIYSLVSIVLAGIELLPLNELAQVALFSIIWSLIPLMYQFAPCVFAMRGSSQIVERLMPARASEKFAFLVGYTMVLVPLVCYLLPTLALVAYEHIPSIQTPDMLELMNLRNSLAPAVVTINSLATAASMLACLYMVLHARSNRMLKGIALSIGVNFLFSFMEGIFGFFMGKSAAAMGAASPVPGEKSPEFISDVMKNLAVDNTFIIASIVVGVAVVGTFLYLIYRDLHSRNI